MTATISQGTLHIIISARRKREKIKSHPEVCVTHSHICSHTYYAGFTLHPTSNVRYSIPKRRIRFLEIRVLLS